MVARFVNKSRPSQPSHSRRSSSSSCAPVKRILGKQHRMAILQQLRAPLSNKAAIVNRSSAHPLANMPTPTVATTAKPLSASTRVRLPRTLPRPALREIDMSVIEEAFPHFAGVPAQYIRDKLSLVAPHMLAALRSVQVCLPGPGLPSELDVELSPASSEALANPPTHMLAVYSSNATAKTKVTLFPAHQLVFSIHCANLPALPSSSKLPASERSRRIPVVPFRLPVPTAFPLLYSYLYTKRADVLLASLSLENEQDIASLTHMAALIQGLWQNTCVLGVVDAALYDILDDAWCRIMTALEKAQSS